MSASAFREPANPMRIRTIATALALTALLARASLAYEAVAVADGGTIKGTVRYKGDPPAPARVAITADREVCGDEKTAQNLLVGPDKGIQNVVAYLFDIERGTALEPGTVTVDQKGCEYVPRVLLFPAGSKVKIRNSDGILHNTGILAEMNRTFTVAQPKSRRVVEKKIEKPEMPIKVQCDVHRWMRGWWIAQAHPYYALTDAAGRFTLSDVPPGTYTLALWHETLGRLRQTVSVAPKATSELTLEMAGR